MRLLLALGLAGCNSVYGLHEVEEGFADLDGDGIPDSDDNCATVPNANQLDSDGDQRGDMCDLCPKIATPFDHDEDGDQLGDACDPCPNAPTFAVDADSDGLDDACDPDPSAPSKIAVFDPFVALDPGVWNARGPGWQSIGDRVVPMGRVDPLLEGLERTDLRVSGDQWRVEIGISSPTAWDDQTPRLGLRFDTQPGNFELYCLTYCVSGMCNLVTSFGTALPITPAPLVRIHASYAGGLFHCGTSDTNDLSTTVGPPSATTVVLVTGSMNPITFAYVATAP